MVVGWGKVCDLYNVFHILGKRWRIQYKAYVGSA